MKKLIIAFIFALSCTINAEDMVHVKLNYIDCPQAIFDDPSLFVSHFFHECITHFGSIDLTFAIPCRDVLVVRATCDDCGAILYMDERNMTCTVEYCNYADEDLKKFRESMDAYFEMRSIQTELADD